MSKPVVVCVSIAVVVVAVRLAFACQCVIQTIDQGARDAPQVFAGQVSGSDGEITVDTVWKGAVPTTVHINSDGSSCHLHLTATPQRWVFFGSVKDGHMPDPGFCSGSRLARPAVETALTKLLGAPRRP
jgi:hypothetical protein